MIKNIFIGLIILAVLGGGAYLLLSQNKQSSISSPSPQVTQEPTAVPSESTTATPEAMKETKEATVTLNADGFSPASLTIKAGTKVTWINKSGTTGNVSSDPHPIHTNYPPLNLGSFADGSSVSLLFDKPGTYGYHNHLNPGQRGTIIVQ